MQPEDPPYFPLRWESTGDQWWYASPIDCAAAHGHYHLVRALLRLDPGLLIKLTSLRRIRRLETLWDDDVRFRSAARSRARVARCLLRDYDRRGKDSLIRAGYGGWLLYVAASAGDAGFVRELLGRDRALVFGEGEYGVTDMLYAAARGGSSEVFRLVLDSTTSMRCSTDGRGGGVDADDVFKWEMTNRAVHAAARGGNLEMLKELLADFSDVLACRDLQGATVLHSASASGQVEVAKDLLASFDIVNSRDNHGNTSLHVAAFQGHLAVVVTIITASPASSTLRNNAGDTFLHMAVTGFRTPGFHRIDRKLDLIKKIISGNLVKIDEIINARNNDGRTALHVAVVGNVHSELVELLMTVRSIDLNIRDNDGMTPLDLLRHQQQPASSEILNKELVSTGEFSESEDCRARAAILSCLKMHGIGNTPGTSFRLSDAQILSFAGVEEIETSARFSSCSNTSKSEATQSGELFDKKKKKHPVESAARRLKFLLTGHGRMTKKTQALDCEEEVPTSLRQRFFNGTSLPNKSILTDGRSSSATKEKSATGLMQGVVDTTPLSLSRSRSSSFSKSSMSSEKQRKGVHLENEDDNASYSDKGRRKSGSLNIKLMNQYFCLGTQGLAVENPVNGQQYRTASRRSLLSVG